MKRTLSLLICAVMLVAVLSACGGAPDSTSTPTPASSGGGTQGDTQGGDTQGGEASADVVDWSVHETFTAWLYATPNDYYSSYSDNPVVQYLNRTFNITLEYEQPATGTEQDSLSLMFGTGEYTDMIDIAYYSGSVPQLYDDGVIVNIADYLEYMPNLKAMMDKYEIFRKTCYTDDGKILVLKPLSTEEELMWGGLVYRRDILETMTGGNISFPSGGDEPTTIADWEYMLPLFQMYFEAAGMAEYAPLILPYNGYFVLGELVSGFGVNAGFYLEGDTVKYGPVEDGFYNYVSKMRDWYAAGYIYKDFASRTNDLFYLPNTALTYGAAAGAWYGLNNQVGDSMSMPDYNLFVDVRPATSPLDSDNGITEAFPYGAASSKDQSTGVVITSKCKNIPKLLSVIDYMYAEENAMLRYYGLSAEQGAADDPYYQLTGTTDGAYWFDGDTYVKNPKMLEVSDGGEPLYGVRLPGLNNNIYSNGIATVEEITSSAAWRKFEDSPKPFRLPASLSRSPEEDVLFTKNNTQITDYVNECVPKFIMGTTELNEASWKSFVDQIKAFGLDENLRIQQEAYDRYLKR